MLLERDARRLASDPVPGYHVRGALKLYSRACFEAIGGIEERLGWDTIDETYARMRGFRTQSFDDSSRATTVRSAPPTARCAAALVTASAPTSSTTACRG